MLENPVYYEYYTRKSILIRDENITTVRSVKTWKFVFDFLFALLNVTGTEQIFLIRKSASVSVLKRRWIPDYNSDVTGDYNTLKYFFLYKSNYPLKSFKLNFDFFNAITMSFQASYIIQNIFEILEHTFLSLFRN